MTEIENAYGFIKGRITFPTSFLFFASKILKMLGCCLVVVLCFIIGTRSENVHALVFCITKVSLDLLKIDVFFSYSQVQSTVGYLLLDW